MALPTAYRYVLRGAVLAAGALAILALTADHSTVTPRGRAVPLPVTPARSLAPVVPMRATVATCPAAPTTAAGYTAMFGTVPASQWGAADVAISTKVGNTVVWLWGDTISGPSSGWNRFVHSSIITQVAGCLRVSHAGAQTLPDDPDGSWYWIKAAQAVDATHLRITADHVVRTGSGVWDFKVVGQRTATAVLTSNGDATFQSWTGANVAPQHIVQKDGGVYAPWTQTVSEISNGKVLVNGLPHTTSNWSYAPSVHPELTLANGLTLLTVCENSSPLTYAGYKPLFYAVAL